ncbi:MAG: hypothetical protein K8R88_11305 [Armatimonadetes bacterium]|nr:hypothetical protein [Armatimonadota bacterium]
MIHTIAGHDGTVHAVAFSPNGLFIATSAADRTIKFWDVQTANLLRTYDEETGSAQFEKGVVALAFSPDGAKVAAGRIDATLVVFRNPFAELKGSVFLTGFSGDVSTQPVSFILKTATGAILDSWTQNLDSNQRFSHIPAVPIEAGDLTLIARGSHWVGRSTSVNSSNFQSLSLTLINGDCNGDNVIDLSDYTIVVTAFNALPTSGNWDARADLNGDNTVDLTDYTILVTNFNSIGA